MAAILGNVILFKVDTNPGGAPSYTVLGSQKDATLTLEADEADATNKGSNYWHEGLASYKTWSVECDSLLIENDSALAAIETAYFTTNLPPASMKIAWSTPTSATQFTGTVNIKSMKYGAPDGDVATLALALTGTGELVQA